MFKLGDKVYLYQKIGSWDHGAITIKDQFFKDKTIGVVCDNEYSRDLGNTSVLFAGQTQRYNVFTSCLKLVSKKQLILIRKRRIR